MNDMLVISILILFCIYYISTIPVLKTASRTEQIFISTAEILNSDLSEVAEFTICLRVMSHQFSDRYQGLVWIPSNNPFPLWLGTIPAPCNYMTSKTMLRLNLVKSAKFQKWFFWWLFIRNDFSRVDLIIKVVLKFLSDL